MAVNPITTPLPADLPTNWTYGQTVAPAGSDAGLTEQHGYNYLMEQVSVVEHPEAYAFEVVLSDLAGQPADVSGITDAVNEIKPAHLDWWFTYQLSQLLAQARTGGGFWRIREVALPAMEEA